MDPYTQVLDKILTIILVFAQRDKLILESLPADKRTEVALAQYADQKAQREFWLPILSVFKPKP